MCFFCSFAGFRGQGDDTGHSQGDRARRTDLLHPEPVSPDLHTPIRKRQYTVRRHQRIHRYDELVDAQRDN